jgi:hypothetical protein
VKNIQKYLSNIFLFAALFIGVAPLVTVSAATTRHPYDQPFHPDNIWNRPIGTGAQYAPANLDVDLDYFGVDEDVIITTPNAPMTEVWYNNIGWSSNAQNARCFKSGGLIGTVPIPSNFLVLQPAGSTPNASTAILRPDGRTFYQTQPLARCQQGGNAFTLVDYQEADMFGTEYRGAHGGSGLSSIGGTIRLGELTNGEEINHALKVNLYAAKHLAYPADGSPGYRWPAWKADSYAADAYQGPNPKVEMGTLLALLPSYNENNLQTEPARKIARALKNYGAYVADDSAWNAIDFAVEQGPEGKVKDEFPARWGFNMNMGDKGHAWFRDLQDIFANLHVVDNNSPSSIGGGGSPRAAGAPALNYIQGHIWIDQNQNGIKEGGEVDINAVTTTLINAGSDGLRGTSDDFLATADAFGRTISATASGTSYTFRDLLEGKYFVRFEGEFPEGALTGGQEIEGNTVVSGAFQVNYDQTVSANLGISIATQEEVTVIETPQEEINQEQGSPSEQSSPQQNSSEPTSQTTAPTQSNQTTESPSTINEPSRISAPDAVDSLIVEESEENVQEGEEQEMSLEEMIQSNQISEIEPQITDNTSKAPITVASSMENDIITPGERIVFRGRIEPRTDEDIDVSEAQCLFSILTPSGNEYRSVQPIASDGTCFAVMAENPETPTRTIFPRSTPLAASLPVDIPIGIYESGYGSMRVVVAYDGKVVHSEAQIWRITYPGGEIAEILSIVADGIINLASSDAGVMVALSVIMLIASYWALHRAVRELDEDFQIIDKIESTEEAVKDLYQNRRPKKHRTRKRINHRK